MIEKTVEDGQVLGPLYHVGNLESLASDFGFSQVLQMLAN